MSTLECIGEFGIKQRLPSIVQARILTSFGHVSRSDNDSIERLFGRKGRIEGTRSRGRLPMIWADQIKAALWLSPYMSVRERQLRKSNGDG
ncbi:jg15849 [Pararge aegeria aegeria]|uniref:Jg15849 protein n=1 Tax=Pararge aegeria aegeria TaxID=348720 RepID=A0A8S4SIV7_9NEOP|nr:jg15849 [Pararge aegeria aegeria]